MKPSALTLTAGIFILALFACVPPTPRQGGVAAPPTLGADVCTQDKFLRRVHYLAQTSPPFSLPDSGFQNAPPTDNTTINTSISSAADHDHSRRARSRPSYALYRTAPCRCR